MPAATPPSASGRRFLADRMLSRFSRWLRLAGEDVLLPAGPGSHEPARTALHRLACAEGRIVITRDRSFPGNRGGQLVIVATDLEEQLREFYHEFPGDPLARAFSRCTACNGPAPLVSRESVLSALPPAVREHGRDFRRCGACGHVYWEGSHSRTIRTRLAALREALSAEGRAAPVAPVALSRTLAPNDHLGWARFDDFLRALVARLDLSWSGYRRPRRSLRAPIVRRMGELGLRNYDQYLSYLESHLEDEGRRLPEILAVPISRFFRDRKDYVDLARVAFPELAVRSRPVRAASLGCASGEEPYTLRLLWDQPVPFEIEAFDVRDDLLARAMKAVYPAASIHSVPPSIRDRSFVRENAGWRLDPAVVASVRFNHLDIFHDPLPGSFDLILCRNVAFTYLGVSRQGGMARRLLDALAPGGFLMIGGGERLPGEADGGFERKGRCLYQKHSPN